jgi:hypothetical protein
MFPYVTNNLGSRAHEVAMETFALVIILLGDFKRYFMTAFSFLYIDVIRIHWDHQRLQINIPTFATLQHVLNAICSCVKLAVTSCADKGTSGDVPGGNIGYFVMLRIEVLHHPLKGSFPLADIASYAFAVQQVLLLNVLPQCYFVYKRRHTVLATELGIWVHFVKVGNKVLAVRLITK